METVASTNLSKNLRINGCLKLSPNNLCLLPTGEGLLIVRFRLVPEQIKRYIDVTTQCDMIGLASVADEPLGLDREQICKEATLAGSDTVQQLKIDRILSPAIRSMGDVLAIRQVCWEPLKDKINTRLAILAQNLRIYRVDGGKWGLAINVTKLLHGYLHKNPMANNTKDSKEKFKAYSHAVTHICWSQVFTSGDNSYSYIIVCNSYSWLLAVRIPTCPESQDFSVHELEYSDITVPLSEICTLQWITGLEDCGTLVIGQRDGSCVVLILNSALDMTAQQEVELKRDYRVIEHIRSVGNNEMVFSKYNQMYIYHMKKNSIQSFVISETKYSLNHITADDNHIYIATCENGFLIKSREDGQTVHHITDPVFTDSCAMELSPNRELLLTLSKTPLYDLYQNKKPLRLKLTRLRPLDTVLQKYWDSSANDITFELFLIIGQKVNALPGWLMTHVDSVDGWSSLTYCQLRIVYIVLHCLVHVIRREDTDELSVKRMERITQLKLKLAVLHMQKFESKQQLSDYITRCHQTSQLNSGWDVSHIPNTICPICDEKLSLSSQALYICTNGHSLHVCSNTMMPVFSATPACCSLCFGPLCDEADLEEPYKVLVTDKCGFCGGLIRQSESFITP